MTRILLFFAAFSFLLTTGCQKCKQCGYTWTKLEIEPTLDGEVEVEIEVTGNLEDGDFDNTKEQECIKRNESFTIEDRYAAEKATTSKLNWDYECVDS